MFLSCHGPVRAAYRSRPFGAIALALFPLLNGFVIPPMCACYTHNRVLSLCVVHSCHPPSLCIVDLFDPLCVFYVEHLEDPGCPLAGQWLGKGAAPEAVTGPLEGVEETDGGVGGTFLCTQLPQSKLL